MIAVLVAANSLAWMMLQMSVARLFVVLSNSSVAKLPLCPISEFEFRLYRDVLRIRRWKFVLPDGGAWVGSRVRKKRLVSRNPEDLRLFELETRRGEWAHCSMLALLPIFFVWNPPRAWPVLAMYAIFSNLPCIFAQRYNRQVLRRLLSSETFVTKVPTRIEKRQSQAG